MIAGWEMRDVMRWRAVWRYTVFPHVAFENSIQDSFISPFSVFILYVLSSNISREAFFARLTSNAVSPRKKSDAQHSVGYAARVSYALEYRHNLPGHQINRQHGSQKSQKCEDLENWWRCRSCSHIGRRERKRSMLVKSIGFLARVLLGPRGRRSSPAKRIIKLRAFALARRKLLTLWNFGTRSTWVVRNTITPITMPTTRNIVTTGTAPIVSRQTATE